LESTGKTGGTLTLAIDGTSAVNDPAFYTTLGDWMAVDCICRGLTFISFETNDPQPDLAESWEISTDQLTYTFKLRQGITFHDGTTFTSADVLANLNRQFDENDKTLPKGAARLLASLGENVTKLAAPTTCSPRRTSPTSARASPPTATSSVAGPKTTCCFP